jgi:hypothetical protein
MQKPGRTAIQPGFIMPITTFVGKKDGHLSSLSIIYGRCQMDEKLQELLADIRERLVRVETKIDNGLTERLVKVEDNQKWLWRTVTGAIIVAVITFIIKGGAA